MELALDEKEKVGQMILQMGVPYDEYLLLHFHCLWNYWQERLQSCIDKKLLDLRTHAMVVGGTIPSVSDKDFDSLNPILAQNIILLVENGYYISRYVFFRSITSSRKDEIEGGFGIGMHCNFMVQSRNR